MNCACALLLIVVLGDPPSQGENWTRLTPTQEELDALKGDQWYGVYFANKKAGYYRYYLGSIGGGDGQSYIVTHDLKIRPGLLGGASGSAMTLRMQFDGSPPFALRRCIETITNGDQETQLVITKNENGYQVRRASGEDQKSRPLKDFDYTLGDELAEDLWLSRNSPIVGDEITMVDLDTDSLALMPVRYRIRGLSSREGEGASASIIELEIHFPGTGSALRRLHDAKSKRLISGYLGSMTELRLESEAVAKEMGTDADDVELRPILVDQALGDVAKIRRIVLDATMSSGVKIPSGPGQDVSEISKNQLRIIVSAGGSMAAEANDLDANSKRTESYPTDHERIRELALRAVGDAVSPAEKVTRILAFVHGYIEPSDTDNPINVYALLQTRSGSASDYTALFTTLARAAGIPCREVTGLVCFGNEDREFYPHTWNEVVIDGRWIGVDPWRHQLRLDGGYLRLTSDSFEEMDLLFAIERLKLVEIEKRE